jgi:hypothetical protein
VIISTKPKELFSAYQHAQGAAMLQLSFQCSVPQRPQKKPVPAPPRSPKLPFFRPILSAFFLPPRPSSPNSARVCVLAYVQVHKSLIDFVVADVKSGQNRSLNAIWRFPNSHGWQESETDRLPHQSRIVLSTVLKSPSINFLVMRMNIRNASAAPPNHRKRRPTRARTKVDSRTQPQEQIATHQASYESAYL